MKKTLITLILSATSIFANAKDIIVITNESLAAEASKIEALFKGDLASVGGTAIAVSDNKGLQADFLAKVLKMDQSKYDTTWAKKSFREGLPKPSLKNNDAEVIEFVKSTPGGIGYISAPSPGVKTLGKF
jgi:ABC-type phosphate transport system substrate-binding protein